MTLLQYYSTGATPSEVEPRLSKINWQYLSQLLSHARSLEAKYNLTWSQKILYHATATYRQALSVLAAEKGSCSPTSCRLSSTALSVVDLQCVEDQCLSCTRRYCAIALAEQLHNRSLYEYTPEDIRQQATMCEEAMNGIEVPHPLWIKAASVLGNVLGFQCMMSQNLDAIEQATVLQAKVLSAWDTGNPKNHIALLNMACALWRRFCDIGNLDDLHRSITMYESALNICSEGHPYRTACLTGLARNLRLRSNYPGAALKDDLQTSVRLFNQALVTAPNGYRDQNEIQFELAWAHVMLFHENSLISHLDQAETLWKAAACGDNYRGRYAAQWCLSTVSVHRFELFGRPSDLDQAVEQLRSAMSANNPNGDLAPGPCNNFASALCTRYMTRGTLDDLEEAILLLREGLRKCPPGQHIRDSLLNNMAECLRGRFLLLNQLVDIHESVDLIQQAVNHRPTDAALLLSLTESLRILFDATQEVTVLDTAIHCHARWQQQDDTGYETSILHHHDLAVLLNCRFRATGNLDDLERAANLCTQCLALRHIDHPKRYITLQLLSELQRQRFLHLDKLSAQDEALALAQEALRLLPSAHIARSGCYFHLARLYLTPSASYFSTDAEVNYYTEAIEDLGCSPQQRMRLGIEVLEQIESAYCDNDSSKHSKLLNCYALVIRLLPHVAYFGLEAPSRLRVLAKAEGLAVNGAANAARDNQLELAVELLEEGRTVFWQQHLRLRSNFHQLPLRLSGPLQALSEQLNIHTIYSSHLKQDEGDKAAREAESAKLRRLGERFDLLVQEARLLPGFERFLMHQTYEFLAQAAAIGPVIVLIAGRQACLALVIRSPTSGTECVHLPGVNLERLQGLNEALQVSSMAARKSQRNVLGAVTRFVKVAGQLSKTDKRQRALEEILTQLWVNVMGPVINALSLKVCRLYTLL